MKTKCARARVSVGALLLFSVCVLNAETTINLHELASITDESEDSRSKLMGLPLGFHRIEPRSSSTNRILIAIHDDHSLGFEWVLPLQTMDDEFTDSFFVRWNPSECPNTSHTEVRKQLSSLLESNDSIAQVTLIGHGLGGVYLSQFARDWKSLVPIDVHVVAAPLRGTVGVFEEKECGEILPKRIPPTIRFFQWRVAPSQNNPVKELSEDPQVVDLEGSLVISLPKMIAGELVDQNHALTVVATRVRAQRLEALEQSTPIDANP